MNPLDFEELVESLAAAVESRLGLGREDPCCPDCAGTCRPRCGFSMDAFIKFGVDRVGWAPGLGPPSAGVARLIDHTLLKPDATEAQIDALCDEAASFGFASVCVNPVHVARCRKRLEGSSVRTCTVIGFPLGATLSQVKAHESRLVQELGAEEMDMVIPIGLLKSGRHDLVQADIEAVVETRLPGNLVKVIIETCLLTDEEKRAACRLAVKAGADYVKTSTGFSTGGATVEDVALMREEVGPAIGVKAAGGVRTREDLQEMVAAGATRVGASAGVRIVKEEAA